MTQTITLLFTSVGRRVELMQAFRQAAAKTGIRLRIIGADITDTAPALTCCDSTVIVPRIKDPAYIPALLDICKAQGVTALIPTIDTDLLLLAQEKDRFAAIGTRVVISSPEKIAICRDKSNTSDYFISLGLYAPEAVSDIARYRGGFPAFIKPADGSSSIGANRADSPEELAGYAAQLDRYVVQPFAHGTEYTVDIFCDLQGNPIYITPRIRAAVRAGEVLKTEIRHEASIIREMQILIRDFKPCGGITVQLIRNEETGVNQYIEINPRFGGGAPLSIKAGADSAAAMLRLLAGETLPYFPEAAADRAVFSRFDQSVCVTRGSGKKIKAVIFDLDDTLYDEKEYVRSGFEKVAALLPEVEDAFGKLQRAFEAGKPAIDTVLQESGLCADSRKAACLETYRLQMPDICLSDEVRSLLQELRRQGMKLGIITDGRPEGQRSKLEALGLFDLVDTVIITDELGGVQFRKPNDIAFRVMQCRLGVAFDEMVYIGDNPQKDFLAPKTLGMEWLWYKNPNGLYSHAEETTGGCVASIAELRAVLNTMI
jgi:HAD superfamily hydrolase (TIGR01549 family)